MRYVVNSPPRQGTKAMAEDTETVDEAEALIQQLLDAGMVERLTNTPQIGDEGGEDGSEEGDGGDNSEDDGDEDEENGSEVGEGEDDSTGPGEPTEPAGTPATSPAAAETPGPFDSLTSEEKAALLKVRALLTDNPDIAEKFDAAVKAKFSPEPRRTQ